MKTKTSNHHYKAKNKVRKATASSLLSTIGGFSFLGWHQFHFLSSSFIHFQPHKIATNLQTCEGKESCKKKSSSLKRQNSLEDAPFKERR
jgi:hypothetical protein